MTDLVSGNGECRAVGSTSYACVDSSIPQMRLELEAQRRALSLLQSSMSRVNAQHEQFTLDVRAALAGVETQRERQQLVSVSWETKHVKLLGELSSHKRRQDAQDGILTRVQRSIDGLEDEALSVRRDVQKNVDQIFAAMVDMRADLEGQVRSAVMKHAQAFEGILTCAVKQLTHAIQDAHAGWTRHAVALGDRVQLAESELRSLSTSWRASGISSPGRPRIGSCTTWEDVGLRRCSSQNGHEQSVLSCQPVDVNHDADGLSSCRASSAPTCSPRFNETTTQSAPLHSRLESLVTKMKVFVRDINTSPMHEQVDRGYNGVHDLSGITVQNCSQGAETVSATVPQTARLQSLSSPQIHCSTQTLESSPEAVTPRKLFVHDGDGGEDSDAGHVSHCSKLLRPVQDIKPSGSADQVGPSVTLSSQLEL